MRVRLLEDYDGHKAGAVIVMRPDAARALVGAHRAIALDKQPEPRQPAHPDKMVRTTDIHAK